MTTNNILYAFLLTLFAGLSTSIGSAISLTAKRTNTKFLSFSLGFSAGVMIYVSMVEIFFKAQDILIKALNVRRGHWVTVISFFCGMFLIALIDSLVPSAENPHDVKTPEGMDRQTIANEKKLLRLGLFTALILAIHNFPEGIATFISALLDPSVAMPIAFAIAIHNIPEGISVSLPIFYATGDKKKAFWYSFFSGMAEPIGALVGYFILLPFLNEVMFGVIFAGVAGIMVFISLDELLPAAREYGEHHLPMYGVISGMILMAVSLLLFI